MRQSAEPQTPLSSAIARSSHCLLQRQAADGHWVGELQGDTILESEYILLMAFLGREREEKVAKAARYILAQQLPDGAWNNYPGGPPDLSVSVKAYFALKLAGHDPASAYMCRACSTIRALGGASGCNSFTKFYLALLGQFPYANCPAVPPEMLLLPKWAYFNIYAMSSWTRTIVVPLSIFYAHKPVRVLPPELGIRELFLEPPETPLWPHPPTHRRLTWTNLFLVLDQLIKRLERWGLGPIRSAALKRAKTWLLDHFPDSDGVGAIFPPIIYTIISLRCLGYHDDTPEMRWALKQLDDLMLEEDTTLRLQPCFSPVWDTALTLIALADAGVPGIHPAMQRAAHWLIEREVRRPGDWSKMNPSLEPGGWFFEYRNGLYPDTDDTSMVLMALAKSGQAWKSPADRGWTSAQNGATESPSLPTGSILLNGASRLCPAAARGVRWLLGMQNRNGGWAAFDRDVDHELLTKVPFADHNAMLDPSCPDITARVLEALGHYGYRVGNRQIDRAVSFLEATQEPTGAWLGRWGVNYLYGTWQVLSGLRSVGYDMRLPMVRRAVAWLQRVQQPGGGWGETCRTYDEPALAGQGPPTASQTAWALLGLLAAGEEHGEVVRSGIDYLLATQ
ncbi:MAG TPA: prenyltransferase/squalene oxidase repeat-containing protein, partial [Gemmataceae bacterium]|nr:prenyltransferase/squalene oxidase repeat-containing protein [Gemmataceae bacterium]